MVLKRLATIFYDKCCIAKYQKIEVSRFKSSHSDRIVIIGKSLDEHVLKSINDRIFDFDRINELEIITTYSNLDKEFFNSWSGLAKFSGMTGIKLRMKILNKPIPPDVYILSASRVFLIPKFCFEKKITKENKEIGDVKTEISEVCLFDHPQEKDIIVQAIESAEDISHHQGTLSYTEKFKKIFEIQKRNFSSDEAEKIINALISWEISGSGYDDIEPLWRIFEEKIRQFITVRLKKKDPATWFSKYFFGVLPPDKQKMVNGSFSRVKKPLGINDFDHHPNPLELVNPGDYKIVIENNRSEFPEFFPTGGSRYLYDLEEVVKTRNNTIHPKATNPPEITSNAIIKSLILIDFLNTIEPSIR